MKVKVPFKLSRVGRLHRMFYLESYMQLFKGTYLCTDVLLFDRRQK